MREGVLFPAFEISQSAPSVSHGARYFSSPLTQCSSQVCRHCVEICLPGFGLHVASVQHTLQNRLRLLRGSGRRGSSIPTGTTSHRRHPSRIALRSPEAASAPARRPSLPSQATEREPKPMARALVSFCSLRRCLLQEFKDSTAAMGAAGIGRPEDVAVRVQRQPSPPARSRPCNSSGCRSP